MQHKTYLELVNEAIAESKVSLDPLTSGNFATPPRTVLYEHFKRWVNRVYKQVLLKRNEWHFRSERAVGTIYPRLQVRMIGVNTLTAGDMLEGQSSGVVFEVLAIHSVEDVEGDTTTEYTISVEYASSDDANNIILNEKFDRTSPSPAVGIGRIKGRGRYDFKDIAAYMDEIDPSSFAIQPAVDTATSPAPGDLEPAPNLLYVPAERWTSALDGFAVSTGRPQYVTQTQDGLWDFYPRPAVAYDIAFTYSQDFTTMTAHGDTPVLLDPKFDDRIMWGAVMEYANWDNKREVYLRAKKWVDEWEFIMNRDALPQITVNVHRFDKRC